MSSVSLWVSTFGVIFAIIDPFGYVPIFISMTSGDSTEKRNWALRRACLTAGTVLILFTLLGNFVLSFFGISVPALQISGGLILLIIGFDMVRILPINAKISADEESEATRKEDISIIPLAIPMLSGPASMATVVVLGSNAQDTLDYAVIISSIVITLGITYVVLRSANKILKAIGLTGLHIVTRIMGLLLCAIAVQLIINGYQAIRS